MKNKELVIILHEIYGVNPFMQEVKKKLIAEGMDADCYDLYHRQPFSYEQTEDAYQFFMEKVGFEKIGPIVQWINEQKKNYEKVYLLGFSVGATLAWILSEKANCDGVICCYGSRIRDYLGICPKCKTLLIFAREDSFDVGQVMKSLEDKNLKSYVYEAKHGFMDSFHVNYNESCSHAAKDLIWKFLR